MRFGDFELDLSVVGEVEMYKPEGQLEDGEVVIGEVPEELRRLFSLAYNTERLRKKRIIEGTAIVEGSARLLVEVFMNEGKIPEECLKVEAEKLRVLNHEIHQLGIKSKTLYNLFWLALESHLNNADNMVFTEDWKVVVRDEEAKQ
jgi:hypothetical protein